LENFSNAELMCECLVILLVLKSFKKQRYPGML
jgi:hypothetical protein